MPFPKNTMKLLALFKLLTANGDAASVILSPLSTSTGGMNTSLFCTAKVGSTHQLEVFAWCSNSGGVFYDFCLKKGNFGCAFDGNGGARASLDTEAAIKSKLYFSFLPRAHGVLD